jgi:hypothetical protein
MGGSEFGGKPIDEVSFEGYYTIKHQLPVTCAGAIHSVSMLTIPV